MSFLSSLAMYNKLWLYSKIDLTISQRKIPHFARFYPAINEKWEPNTNHNLARSSTFDAAIFKVWCILIQNWSIPNVSAFLRFKRLKLSSSPNFWLKSNGQSNLNTFIDDFQDHEFCLHFRKLAAKMPKLLQQNST